MDLDGLQAQNTRRSYETQTCDTEWRREQETQPVALDKKNQETEPVEPETVVAVYIDLFLWFFYLFHFK